MQKLLRETRIGINQYFRKEIMVILFLRVPLCIQYAAINEGSIKERQKYLYFLGRPDVCIKGKLCFSFYF